MIAALIRFLCRQNVHLVVEEGCGMMRDGLRCLVCDRERYPEVFGIAVIRRDIKKVRKL